MMSKTILFATDLGVFSPYILQHVLSMARDMSARVVVVHVVEPLSLFAEAVLKSYMPDADQRELEEGGYEHILSSIKDRLIDSLADDYMEGDLSLGLIRDVRVVRGAPADAILAQAALQGADMIVMGSRGHDAGAPLLGSVTSRVLQLSTIPVLTVPPSATLSALMAGRRR